MKLKKKLTSLTLYFMVILLNIAFVFIQISLIRACNLYEIVMFCCLTCQDKLLFLITQQRDNIVPLFTCSPLMWNCVLFSKYATFFTFKQIVPSVSIFSSTFTYNILYLSNKLIQKLLPLKNFYYPNNLDFVSFSQCPSLVAQTVKNLHLPAMRETWVQSWVGKIPWRRERLPTPIV